MVPCSMSKIRERILIDTKMRYSWGVGLEPVA